jgi:hypothetical protein
MTTFDRVTVRGLAVNAAMGQIEFVQAPMTRRTSDRTATVTVAVHWVEELLIPDLRTLHTVAARKRCG